MGPLYLEDLCIGQKFGAVLEALGFSYYETAAAAGTAQMIICASGRACGQGTPWTYWPFGDQVNDADVMRGYDYEAKKQSGCK